MYILENLHWFLLLIGALVFFHELGHFLVAKACNVKVERFSLGFGPRIFGFTRGETEYRLGLLPLGGYVKMLGEVPGSEIPVEEMARSFSAKPVWQRAAIAVAGPLANLLLAVVVYFGMFLGPQTLGDTRLGIVSRGEPAWNAGLRPGDKIIAVSGTPIAHWDELKKLISARPGAAVEVTFERDGEQHNVQIEPQARDEENVFQETEKKGKIGVSLQFLKPIIAIVDEQSPAAAAGVKTGDVVQAIDGTSVASWHEMRAALLRHADGSTPVQMKILRDNKTLDISLMPALSYPTNLPTDLFSGADTGAGYTGLVSKDTLVMRVDKDTPAETAGLQPGDRLLQIAAKTPDGHELKRPIEVWGIDLASFQGLDARSTMEIYFQRGQEVRVAQFQLQAKEEKDEFKNVRKTYVFGATNDPTVLDTYIIEHQVGALEAFTQSFSQVGEDMTLISTAVGKMLRGHIPLDTMGGPIMLFVIAEQSAKRGATYFLRMMSVISVNLGMMNLLPIPVLDGGHLMFCAVEAIRRRPPSLRLREVANIVGLALLLMMMVLAFRNDLLRFVLG